MSKGHVETILAHDTVPTTLREAVRRSGASASFRPLSQALRSGLSPQADAVIIVLPDDIQPLQHPLRVLFDRLAEQPRAVLLMKANGGVAPKLAHPATVPITFGCSLNADELTSRLATMLDMRPSLDSLHRGALANRQQETYTTQLYERQLRLARQIQREFIPSTLPRFGPVSFSALFRPTDYVSGDIYDIHRLDEDHVAIALVDATGHGIPAALVTVFIKRALRGKEIHNGCYRIVPPDEVLAALNEELLEVSLSECRFIAATYAVLNTRTLELTLARGGSPYPILRRKDGTLELVRPPGSVIGVLPHATYPAETVQLEAGDTLVICSDGVDAVVSPHLPATAMAQAFARAAAMVAESDMPPAAGAVDTALPLARPAPRATTLAPTGQPHAYPSTTVTALAEPPRPPDSFGHTPVRRNGNGVHRRGRLGSQRYDRDPTPRDCGLPPDEAVLASSWCVTLGKAGARAALDELTIRYESLRRMGHPLDDLTVLALQVEA